MKKSTERKILKRLEVIDSRLSNLESTEKGVTLNSDPLFSKGNMMHASWGRGETAILILSKDDRPRRNGMEFYFAYFPHLDDSSTDGSMGSDNSYRLATEQEKQILLEKIDKEGYVFDFEKLELRKKELELIDGEFYCVYGKEIDTAVFQYRETGDYGTYYALLSIRNLCLVDNAINHYASNRIATATQRQIDDLKAGIHEEYSKIFNEKTKRFEKRMSEKEKFEEWKAENLCRIPTIESHGDAFYDIHHKLVAIQELMLCAKYLNGGLMLFPDESHAFKSNSFNKDVIIERTCRCSYILFKNRATIEKAREILGDDLIKTALT